MTGTTSAGGLLDRHLAFLQALRSAGLPVSLAEGLDAVAALSAVTWSDREVVRDAYAATLVKRQSQRPTFEAVFDLHFPRLVGGGATATDQPPGDQSKVVVRDGPESLAALRADLEHALAANDQAQLRRLATDAVGRFGAMRGRGPGLSRWSAYTTLQRVSPDSLVEQLLAALLAEGRTEEEASRVVRARLADFTRMVEEDAHRRIAEDKGPDHATAATVRPTIDRIDFTTARRTDLDRMRREIYPLARRLATRLTQERHARGRGALDFRRTVRASISSGGVPLVTHHKPRRPHRTELVVLCDVSGSVANFAQFTLLLVYALRDQFTKVRAFTFVDQVHEVTDRFRPGADAAAVLTDLAASAAQASTWGRTNYGRAFSTFVDHYPDAVGPRSSLLILGDARSNYSDLALPALRQLASSARHSWWLNPEHRRHWDTGDSAAGEYAAIVPMVECRNLAQLGEFVHDLV
ncbi:MAG: VWA domain-containing protein [Nocardioides sp.]|uniref:vWA domain-containing protein n=1 Tax=Nocardioides sp. TaxID=35761 RepID=UPI0039E65687